MTLEMLSGSILDFKTSVLQIESPPGLVLFCSFKMKQQSNKNKYNNKLWFY